MGEQEWMTIDGCDATSKRPIEYSMMWVEKKGEVGKSTGHGRSSSTLVHFGKKKCHKFQRYIT
jgi:hypothetical protein